MSMPPPAWSDLWRDIVAQKQDFVPPGLMGVSPPGPKIRWPQINEVDMALIGEDWQKMATPWVAAGPPTWGEQERPLVWHGLAGQEYRRQVDEVRKTARMDGDEMAAVGRVATIIGEEVLNTKQKITSTIEHHEDVYLGLTKSLWAWFFAEEASREAESYRLKVAWELDGIIAAGLSAIAARTGTG